MLSLGALIHVNNAAAEAQLNALRIDDAKKKGADLRKSLPFVVLIEEKRIVSGNEVADRSFVNPTEGFRYFSGDPRSVDGFATLSEAARWILRHRDEFGLTVDARMIPGLRERYVEIWERRNVTTREATGGSDHVLAGDLVVHG